MFTLSALARGSDIDNSQEMLVILWQFFLIFAVGCNYHFDPVQEFDRTDLFATSNTNMIRNNSLEELFINFTFLEGMIVLHLKVCRRMLVGLLLKSSDLCKHSSEPIYANIALSLWERAMFA